MEAVKRESVSIIKKVGDVGWVHLRHLMWCYSGQVLHPQSVHVTHLPSLIRFLEQQFGHSSTIIISNLPVSHPSSILQWIPDLP